MLIAGYHFLSFEVGFHQKKVFIKLFGIFGEPYNQFGNLYHKTYDKHNQRQVSHQ